MGRNIVSVSLEDDVYQAIMQFKAKGGNVSGLINNLLKSYFFGNLDSNQAIKEIVRIIELEKKFEEFEEFLKSAKEELKELKSKLQEKIEIKKAEEEIPLIRELRYSVFADIEDFESFESRLIRYGRNPRDAIKARLQAWAAEKQIPYPEAVRLFCKAFPEFKVFEVEEGSKP